MLNLDDPLVPVPMDLDSFVNGAFDKSPGAGVESLIAEYFNQFAVRMPGFDSVGNPITPPDLHVLDHLARAWDLVDSEVAGQRPAAQTVACPVEDIECDLCAERARYDTRIGSRAGEHEWIFACVDCAREHGVSTLGAGESVYLMYEEEIPPRVREACDALRHRQGLESLWPAELDAPEPRTRQADRLQARVDELLHVVREEFDAVRADVDAATNAFTIDDQGMFRVSRRQFEHYRRLVARRNKLVQALKEPDSDDTLIGSCEPERAPAGTEAAVQEGTTTPGAPASYRLSAAAVSVRLRSLWIDELGPLLRDSDHDLGRAWTRLYLRRIGRTLVIAGDIDFGSGDPFADEVGATIARIVQADTQGAITAIRYEHALRGIATARRERSSSLDIYHPDDSLADEVAPLAAALSTALASTSNEAKAVLGGIHVAGISRFRVWLAVAGDEDRRAIGATPGAAADLKIAMRTLSPASEYDIVVDPSAGERYERLAIADRTPAAPDPVGEDERELDELYDHPDADPEELEREFIAELANIAGDDMAIWWEGSEPAWLDFGLRILADAGLISGRTSLDRARSRAAVAGFVAIHREFAARAGVGEPGGWVSLNVCSSVAFITDNDLRLLDEVLDLGLDVDDEYDNSSEVRTDMVRVLAEAVADALLDKLGPEDCAAALLAARVQGTEYPLVDEVVEELLETTPFDLIAGYEWVTSGMTL